MFQNPLFVFIYLYSSAGPAQLMIDYDQSSEPFAVQAAFCEATFHSKNAGSEVSAEAPHPVPGIRHQNKGITHLQAKSCAKRNAAPFGNPCHETVCGFFGFFLPIEDEGCLNHPSFSIGYESLYAIFPAILEIPASRNTAEKVYRNLAEYNLKTIKDIVLIL